MSYPTFSQLGVVPRAPEKRSVNMPPPTTASFILIGESFLARDTIEDIFCPRFIPYPYPMRSIPKNQDGLDGSYGRHVDHLDITKTWKGLSSGQAEELIFWENLFRKVLSELLHNQLEFLRQETGLFGGKGCAPLRGTGDDDFHYIPISILDIVLAMVERFKNAHRRYRWFVSTGNLYNSVAQFVRTHDCFTPDSIFSDRGDNLRVGVKFGEPDLRLTPTLSQHTDTATQVVWNPGYLCFEEFDLTPREGGEFCLTPTYNPPFIAPSTTPRASLHGNIVYTTSAGWLHWDPQAQSFYGTVPYLSEAQQLLNQGQELSVIRSHYQDIAYTLRITVRAIVIEHLDGKVRFEQSIRARVTINVARGWVFESSPRLVNDLYSPEKGISVAPRVDPLALSKLHLSEKLGAVYGGVYDSFRPGIGNSNCQDVQCFSCLFPNKHDASTPWQNPFNPQAPGNQGSQNECSSGSDTLGNFGVSKSATLPDYPPTSHNSFTWDYKVLTPEGTMKKHRNTTVPLKHIWPGSNTVNGRLHAGKSLGPNEPADIPLPSANGTTPGSPHRDASHSLGENPPSAGLSHPTVYHDATGSLKRNSREVRLSSEESDGPSFAGWLRRGLGSSEGKAGTPTDSGYGSASNKHSDGNSANDNPTNETTSKRSNDGASSDLCLDNSESNRGSFETAGSDRSEASTGQQASSLGTGAIEDGQDLKDEQDAGGKRKMRVKVASDEAVKAVNLLTLSLQDSREREFKKLGTPWLVHQEKKAEFAQMLRRRSQQEQELLGSDMEDIFFASSSDSSSTDSEDENPEPDEGVPLHSSEVE